MPVFEIYFNRTTGYVDQVVKRPRQFTIEKVTEVKDIQELFKTIKNFSPEIPVILDVIGINGAVSSISLNPHLSDEDKTKYLRILSEFRLTDAGTLIEYDGPSVVELGSLLPSRYVAQAPNQPSLVIVRYVDP